MTTTDLDVGLNVVGEIAVQQLSLGGDVALEVRHLFLQRLVHRAELRLALRLRPRRLRARRRRLGPR